MTRAFALALLLAAPAAAAEPPHLAAFPGDIKPLLAAYCGKCHNPAEQEGGVDFASVTDAAAAAGKGKLWKRAAGRLRDGDMPPAEVAQTLASIRKMVSQPNSGKAMRQAEKASGAPPA